jgi:uncharacterized protein YggE
VKRRAGVAALAILVVAAALVAVLRPHGGAAAASDTPSTITVSGNGSVTTVPDRASFGFTVETRAATAAAALAQNATGTRAVIAAVKNAGVADADVQTAQVSLSPQTSNDGTAITGYVASNTVTANIRDLAKAGRVVDVAVAAGATGVNGPSLFKGDTDALYRDALKAAVADARTKAAALAAAANQTLGHVQSIVEGGSGPIPVAIGKAAPDAGSTPIEPGTTQITASVTVTFTAA